MWQVIVAKNELTEVTGLWQILIRSLAARAAGLVRVR